jgi:formyltetrahydrofolate-dependent phosphoribosylglycinamide formyltransferase
MDTRINLAVLISGGGTTLQNLIDKIAAGDLKAAVQVVISSSSKAFGLERARRHNIPTAIVRRKDFADDDAFGDAITAQMDRYPVDLVILGGFLKFWKIPTKYEGRVMNIHPALIPMFCGKDFYGHSVHEAVLASGVRVSGCTVHFADNMYDHGPIIIQRTVPVLDDDTPETLAKRVFEQECIAYPEAIRLFAAGRLKIEGSRVRVLR